MKMKFAAAALLLSAATAFAQTPWLDTERVLDLTKSNPVLDKASHLPGKSGYVGSEKCGMCHSDKFDLWKKSAHSLALREIDQIPESDMPEWSGVHDYHNPVTGSELRFELKKENGQYLMILHDSSANKGDPITIYIQRAGYGFPLQYFYAQVDGEWVWAPAAFNRENNRWIVYTDSEWYKPDGSLNYKNKATIHSFDAWCSACHFTGLEYRHENGVTKAKYTEMRVGCERCHGGGEEHVKTGGDPTKIINPAKFTTKQKVDLCGQCHGRATSKPHGLTMFAMNDDTLELFKPGDDLSDYVTLDGWSHPNIWSNTKKPYSMQQKQSSHDLANSKHGEAGMSCVSCHNPHGEIRVKDEGFKLPISDNSLCVSCHADLKTTEAQKQHTKHDKFMQCSDCHMPKNVFSRQLGGDHKSHTFNIITPKESLELFERTLQPGGNTEAVKAEKGNSTMYKKVDLGEGRPGFCTDGQDFYPAVLSCKPYVVLNSSCDGCHAEYKGSVEAYKKGQQDYDRLYKTEK